MRTNAISLLKSDGVLIADNQLTYAAERGRGIVIEFDSDDNRIVNNAITSTDAASTDAASVLSPSWSAELAQRPLGVCEVAGTHRLDPGLVALTAVQ